MGIKDTTRVERFDSWMAALEARHLDTLRLPEVTRALRALSADYVERRDRAGGRTRAALEGRGKRAAFSLFYAPLHFLIVREVVRALGAAVPVRQVTDIGCGTGAAGAAWASEIDPPPHVIAIDRLGWALDEAALTYRQFGLSARLRRQALPRTRLATGPGPSGHVAAYAINELDHVTREAAKRMLLERARGGDAVLVIEPIAKRVAPWWPLWAKDFLETGARADEWRFALPLPERVRTLARAAGLDAREQTARSLWVFGL
jgi:hypothetical protein